MIDIGVSTACLYPLETEKSFETLGKSGIGTTEIFFNALCELSPKFIRQLKKIKDEYGMKVVSVHPTMSLAESFMLFSAYARRYDEGISQYKRYAEVAAELGAEYIIMHGGKPNDVLDNYGYCERFARIADAVKESGAQLLQENVVNYRAGNLEMLKYMAETLDDVGFCIDVKQSVRGGYSPFDALEAVSGHIRHLHISDHTAENDCMLPLRGNFDFAGFFKTADDLGYCGAAMIEVYRNAYKNTEEISESYRKLKNFYCGSEARK